jgi:hypothetical protein
VIPIASQEKIFMIKSTRDLLIMQTLYRRTLEFKDGELWQTFTPISQFYERQDGLIIRFASMTKEMRDDLEYIGDL